MQHGHWPWVIFIVVATPLAVYGELDGIVSWLVPISIVTGRGLAIYGSTDWRTQVIGIVAAYLAIHATSRWSGSLQDVDTTTIALLLASCCMYLLDAFTALWKWREATVLRAYAYTIGMFISSILSTLHVRQLSHLAALMPISNTTTTPCTLSADHSSGFLFAAKDYVDTCPTAVWDDVRLNALFATQIYVLYTLTTGLKRDYDECTPYGYIPGTLSVVECMSLSAAAAVQFDLIPGCNVLNWGVAVLLLVSQAMYILRRCICQWFCRGRTCNVMLSDTMHLEFKLKL